MSQAEDLLNSLSEDGSSLGNVLRWDGDTTNSECLPGTNLWRVSTQAISVDNIIGSKLAWSSGDMYTITADDIEDLRSVYLEVDDDGDATIQGEPMYKISCSLSGTEEVHMVVVTESYIADALVKRGVYLLKTDNGWVESVATETEIFDSGSSTGGAIYYDTEPHIVIGADRHITVPQELKRLAVQHDHNIETVTFDCPRYWDNHDMSRMKVYINFIRADKKPGVYPVDSAVTVDTIDNTIMHFDWTISREVTEACGNIIFLVCIKSVDDDGNEHEHWNSELCKDCYISEGLEVLEAIINKYPDVITHLLTRMDIVENKTTLQSMLNYLDTYFKTDSDINEVLKNYVTEWLSEDTEAQLYIADVINTYVKDVLKPTDTTLSIEGGVADAAATGDAIRNIVNVTNDTGMNDSVVGVLKFNKLYGRSEQIKTTGAQLIDTDAFTSAIDATFAVNGNVITATGIKSYAGIRYVIPNPTAYAGKYLTLSCKSISKSLANEGHCIAQLAIQKTEGSTEYFSVNVSRLVNTFKISGDVSIITLQIMVNNSTASLTTNNTVTVTDLMLNLGETALPWEPYTGGVATPNPSYPQEINSAGDDGFVIGTVSTKNLFDKTKYIFVDGKTIDTETGNLKSTTVNGWMSFENYMAVAPNTDYIMSGDVVPTSWTSTIAFYDADKEFLGIQKCVNSGSKTYKFTTPENANYIRFSVHASALNTDTIQIERGSTVTLYVEGQSRDISIPTPNGIPGLPVTDASLANYTDPDGQMWCCDEIDFERGVYVQRVGKIDIDNSLTFYYNTDNYFLHTAQGVVSNVAAWETRIISSHFLPVSASLGMSEYGWLQFDSNGGIRFKIKDVDTVDGLLTWLETNKPTVIYPLVTPIETSLTSEQILAIRDLSSGEGGTNVYFEDGAPGVELEYPRTLAASYILKNQKDLADIWEAISAIQQTIDAINEAIPYKVVIDDAAGTINFIDR